MKYKQYDIWLADLNPAIGTEPGKTRPVVIVQTNLLNDIHKSTLVCPTSTNIKIASNILRVHLKKSQLPELSDILVDQIRAIDNKRFIKRLGKLNREQIDKMKENIAILLDL